MADRAVPDDLLEGVVKVLVDVRLVALLLVLLFDAAVMGSPVARPLVVLITTSSAALLLLWGRVRPLLRRRPWLLVVDVVAFVPVLAVSAAQGPVLHYALATAALVGVLLPLRGALAVGAIAAGAHVGALGVAGTGPTFVDLLGAPLLHPAVAGLASLAVDEVVARRREVARRRRSEVAEEVARQRAMTAVELHDSALKTVHGIRWVADHGPDEPADRLAARLDDVRAAAIRAADELRTTLRALHDTDATAPGPLDEELRARTDRWSELTGVPVDLALDGTVPALSGPDRRHVLAVVGEALENVRRHAGAARVVVTVHDGPDLTAITVADDGVGLPAEPRDGGLGITGMQLRAERLGGRLEVGPGPAGGTTVTLALPARVSA